MLGAVLFMAALTTGWFVLRGVGCGRPFPVWLIGLLDNPVTDLLSAKTTLIQRAGVLHGMRVLDAGCGPGRLTIPLARLVGAGGQVVALDVQEGMLERVRKRAADERLNNIRTVRAGLEANTDAGVLRPASFDRVLLVTVLGEIPDREGAVRSLYSALKPGGLLSVTELIIDPDYQPRREVRAIGQRVGFELDRSFGNALAFTQNLRKPS